MLTKFQIYEKIAKTRILVQCSVMCLKHAKYAAELQPEHKCLTNESFYSLKILMFFETKIISSNL